jgi:hypothetical protein
VSTDSQQNIHEKDQLPTTKSTSGLHG